MANIVDLVYLQGLVKAQPEGYKDEAMKQYQQFLTQYEIFQLKPSKEHKEFSALIKFISQIAPCYPTELQTFPSQLAELLEHNALILTQTQRNSRTSPHPPQKQKSPLPNKFTLPFF